MTLRKQGFQFQLQLRGAQEGKVRRFAGAARYVLNRALDGVASLVSNKSAVLQFGYSLPQLPLGIHHDGAIPGHRLLDRFS
jgi:Helix-turn-helix domain